MRRPTRKRDTRMNLTQHSKLLIHFITWSTYLGQVMSNSVLIISSLYFSTLFPSQSTCHERHIFSRVPMLRKITYHAFISKSGIFFFYLLPEHKYPKKKERKTIHSPTSTFPSTLSSCSCFPCWISLAGPKHLFWITSLMLSVLTNCNTWIFKRIFPSRRLSSAGRVRVCVGVDIE